MKSNPQKDQFPIEDEMTDEEREEYSRYMRFDNIKPLRFEEIESPDHNQREGDFHGKREYLN